AAEPTRRELHRVMPGQSYLTARPLSTIIDREQQSWRFGAILFGAFGGLAFVVAAVGLYGVISYGVTQRTHELGVRVALGARDGDVMRLVLGQGMRLTVAGVAIGLVLAWAAGSQLQPLLCQQSARDVRVMGAVAATLLVVAVLACGVPARRATRANPNDALRAD
ncbi:MAG: FtsX-like permease family protein, partial [Gemmatimonadaceae bacterium]|nr:FtsX-like permease family protein [Gemmatimonadaceae bacterium]